MAPTDSECEVKHRPMRQAIEEIRKWRTWILTSAVVGAFTLGGAFALVSDTVGDNAKAVGDLQNWVLSDASQTSEDSKKVDKLGARQKQIVEGINWIGEALEAIADENGVKHKLPPRKVIPNGD